VLPLLCAWTLAFFQAHPAARQSSTASQWDTEIQAFERADRANPPEPGGILFTGSSSIRLWTSLADHVPGLPVLNRGFGGSQIHEVTALADRVVLPYAPAVVLLYGGTNDIFLGRPAPQVVDDFKAFVARIHRTLPGTRIAFISIAPNPARWSLRPQFEQVNAAVGAWAAGAPLVDYIDVATPMLGGDGRPRPDIFADDQLHMNEKGYGIWKTVMGEYLARVAAGAPMHAAGDGDWTPLWNGKDLSGWQQVGPGRFVVEDGMLRTEGGMGLLWYTPRRIGDAVLRIVFKPEKPKSNSGIFIRIPEAPTEPWRPVHTGYEVQIYGSGDDHHTAGVLYSFTRAKARPVRPGEWNTMEITLDGPRTLVHLNGTLVTDFTEGQPVAEASKGDPARGPRPLTGYIGLQNHGKDDVVWFRDIAVRELRTKQESPAPIPSSGPPRPPR